MEFAHFFAARLTRAVKEIVRLQGRLREIFYLLWRERFGRSHEFDFLEMLACESTKERARLRRVRKTRDGGRARNHGEIGMSDHRVIGPLGD